MLTLKHLKKASRQRSQYGEPRSGEMQDKFARLTGHEQVTEPKRPYHPAASGTPIRKWDPKTGEYLIVDK